MNQFGESVLQCVDFLTGRVHPTDDEIWIAMYNANYHVSVITHFRGWVKEHFSEGPDAFDTADVVLRAIWDDHGGKDPYEVLDFWKKQRQRYSDRQIFATPEQKRLMVEIWERWNDEEKLRNQLEPVYRLYYRRDLTEEEILEATACLKDWLVRRKSGQAY